MTDGLSVVVCDDRRLLADALTTYIAMNPEIARAVATYDAGTAVSRTRHDADVLVLRLALDAGGTAPDVIQQIRGTRSPVPILTVGATEDLAAVAEALSLGADGFVDDDCRPEELMASLLRVVHHEVALPRAMVGPVLADLRARVEDTRTARAVLDHLTEREREVLGLLVDGLVVSQIAKEMGVSDGTIRTHIQHLFQKLGVHSQLAAAAYGRLLDDRSLS